MTNAGKGGLERNVGVFFIYRYWYLYIHGGKKTQKSSPQYSTGIALKKFGAHKGVKTKEETG